MAAIGSACWRWASRTAWAMAMALVVVPWMPHFLTSAPVLGALQVDAMEPYSVQILRLTRSIHFQVGTLSTTDSRPRTSTVVSGEGARSATATDVICSSGYARPIMSASITG